MRAKDRADQLFPAHKQMKDGGTNLEAAANEVIEGLKKQLENPDLTKKEQKAISQKIAGVQHELNVDLKKDE